MVFVLNVHYQHICIVILVKIPISEEVLFEDNCLVSPERRKISFTALQNEERPKEKDVVGLDAEFVSLNQVKLEEMENRLHFSSL